MSYLSQRGTCSRSISDSPGSGDGSWVSQHISDHFVKCHTRNQCFSWFFIVFLQVWEQWPFNCLSRCSHPISRRISTRQSSATLCSFKSSSLCAASRLSCLGLGNGGKRETAEQKSSRWMNDDLRLLCCWLILVLLRWWLCVWHVWHFETVSVFEWYCWWLKSGDHQLRLVGYPIIYDEFYHHPRWFSRRISEPSTSSDRAIRSLARWPSPKAIVWKRRSCRRNGHLLGATWMHGKINDERVRSFGVWAPKSWMMIHIDHPGFVSVYFFLNRILGCLNYRRMHNQLDTN